MGLPGSGKSTFAEPLAKSLFGIWINADQVREKYDDWDFSTEGRIRQSQRRKYEDTNKIFTEPEDYDIRIEKWIDTNQLFKCLDGFNHGIKDTENFSRELTQRLAKLQ